jgi:alpha-beta hydrolase superfamily lysophospholipase
MPGATVHRVNRSSDGGPTVVGHVHAPLDVGRAVVLVHGVCSSSRAYQKLADHLVAHGEVHAVDLPGSTDPVGVAQIVLEAWRSAGRGIG